MSSPYTKGFLGAMEAILVSNGVGAVRTLLSQHVPHTALETAAIALIDKALEDLGEDGFEPARNLIEALAHKQGKGAVVKAAAELSLTCSG